MRHQITLLSRNTVVTCEHGADLLSVLREAGSPPPAPCGGSGKCGKCKVIVNGELKLACQTFVECDLSVAVPENMEKTVVLADGISSEGLTADPVKDGYLLAVDIGTTTVVCYLLDPETGRELSHASMLNPQQPFGADVISRIRAALDGQFSTITALIRSALTSLITSVCEDAGISPDAAGVIAIVGNPAMQQLFLGIDPKNLVSIPFDPVLTHAERCAASDYLPILKNAELLTIPDIAGYVGADTVGCILATQMDEAVPVTLMVDIGTNGEMVLGNRERLAACATAAGPALEGANIRFGMRGAAGAIDQVKWENGAIVCHVIGDGKAAGICGSGLIDAVAVAIEHGLINKRGRIQSPEERDGERIISLCDDIYLTQEDIRQVMLAKGAIAAGIQLLAEHLGYTVNDIDEILLAGAFGSFLNAANACRIGLLPPQLSDRIRVIGNAAGSGAKRAAISQKEFRRTETLVEKTEFIELASIPTFQKVFAKQMALKE